MNAKVKEAMQYFRGKEESCVKLSSGFQNEVYEYTLQDLQYRIEREIPYTNVDFLTFV
ncbi:MULTISPECIES: hypothetical protein [unclassified Bacillus (in: firmicutes)]|uniref:Uncharacterized protein n=1 Tax=Bacillus bruguierae TaxID=3127667 RepID=A0ABU8FMZ8_9BACI|nr:MULTISPECIES: hypothetical protein [unclassified Bacillus (in: firmicutes)]SFJ31678.1 hypothetical protein SAMN04488574_11037 [Bacillus sp. 71mf]SFT02108.1 hypothetical protein SAMN04488145_10799 [Bacillus sp. 103mf]